MNKILRYIAAPVLLLGAFFACEVDTYELPSNIKHVAFEGSSVQVAENTTDTLSIPVYLSTTVKSVSTEVSFELTSLDGSTPAVEGEDFVIINKDDFELNGEDIFNNLLIYFIDNDTIDGDKAFVINLAASSTLGISLGIGGYENNSYTVKIYDDEHPLAFLFGDYVGYSHTLRYDTVYSHAGLISSVEGSNTEITIDGLWYGANYNDIHATVNLEGDSIIIEAGQILTSHDDYGYVYVTYTEVIDGERYLDTERDIIGHINSDSTITFTNFGFYVNSSYATGFFDWFDVANWIKQ